MVTCDNKKERYRVVVSNGRDEIASDTTDDKGGGGSAMRPHEFLEAALAACLNMTIRMHADREGIPLTKITTQVSADRSRPGHTIFRYSFDLEGALTNEQREGLQRVAEACPVRKTLSNAISFVGSV